MIPRYEGYQPSKEGPENIQPPTEPPIKERIAQAKLEGAGSAFRRDDIECLVLRNLLLPCKCGGNDCRSCGIAHVYVRYLLERSE